MEKIELNATAALDSNSCTQEVCANTTRTYIVKVDGKKIPTTISYNNRRLIITPGSYYENLD